MECKFVLTLSIDDGSVKIALFDIGSSRLKFVEGSHYTLETTHSKTQVQHTCSPSNDALVTKLLGAIDMSLMAFKEQMEDKIDDVVCISITSELSGLQMLSIDDEQLSAWQMMDASRPMQECFGAHRNGGNCLASPLPTDRRRPDGRRVLLKQRQSSRSTETTSDWSDPSQPLLHWRTFSTFLRSLLCAELMHTNIFEAGAFGSYDEWKECWSTSTLNNNSDRTQTAKVDHVESEKQDLLRKVFVSKYVQRRFGFREDCTLAECLPAALTAWITLPHTDQRQTMLKIGRNHDALLLPVMSGSQRRAVPNPISFFRSSKEIDGRRTATHLFHQIWNDAGTIRDSFRRTYTKTWRAFKQLIDAVCPGGSVGLDNKLFLFALGSTAGFVRKYENGIKVSSFNDLRANVRCLIEGQALQIRAACSRVRLDELKQRSQKHPSGSIVDDNRLINLLREELKTDRWWIIDEDPGAPYFLDVFCQVLGGEFVRSKKSDAHGDGAASASEVGAAVFAAYTHCAQDFGNQSLDLQEFAARLLKKSVPDSMQSSLKHSARVGVQPTLTMSTHPPTVVGRRSMPSSIYSSGKEVSESPKTRRRPTLPLVPSSLKDVTPATSSFDVLKGVQVTSPLILTPAYEEHHDADETADADTFEQLAVGDRDVWDFYGAMLEEHLRLASVTYF